jgi:hypothetical protein
MTTEDLILALIFLQGLVELLLLLLIFHRQGAIARAAEDFIEGALLMKSDEEAEPILAKLRKRFPVK